MFFKGSPIHWLSSTIALTVMLLGSSHNPSQAFDLSLEANVSSRTVAAPSQHLRQSNTRHSFRTTQNKQEDQVSNNTEVTIVDGAFDDPLGDLTPYVWLLRGAKFAHETEEWLAYATSLNIIAPMPTLEALRQVAKVADTYDVLYSEKFAMGKAIRQSGNAVTDTPEQNQSVHLSSAQTKLATPGEAHVDLDPEYLIHQEGDKFQTVSNISQPLPEQPENASDVPFNMAAITNPEGSSSTAMGLGLSVLSLLAVHFIIKQVVLDH